MILMISIFIISIYSSPIEPPSKVCLELSPVARTGQKKSTAWSKALYTVTDRHLPRLAHLGDLSDLNVRTVRPQLRTPRGRRPCPRCIFLPPGRPSYSTIFRFLSSQLQSNNARAEDNLSILSPMISSTILFPDNNLGEQGITSNYCR
jgi:hypothetical protein